jgi:hypothetical protein
MTDLSITAASCLPGTNAVTEDGLAGDSITAGQVVYKAADGTYVRADSDSLTALARAGRGIALNSASAGQPLRIQIKGDITIGGTMTAGVTYYASKTAGGICPLADLTSGGYAGTVGMAKSTTVLALGFNYSGVAM